jgi:hypothetical protein
MFAFEGLYACHLVCTHGRFATLGSFMSRKL